jgi:AcrR family transcriptional regulator
VTPVSPAPSPIRAGTTAERIARAASDVIARQGLRDTSVDDIAIAAGCGRATVYRAFPGGRAELLVAALSVGVEEVFAECTTAVDATTNCTDAIVTAVHTAACALDRHGALQRLLTHEPGVILPFISFDRVEPLLARAAAWGAEHFSRFVSVRTASEVGEWCARVVLDHLRSPSALNEVTDLVAVRRLVESHLVPALDLSLQPEPSTTAEPSRSL